ncbi:hypothetical protein [Micromonospora aurantiaca (nom. illeg.)]|uniref:hypothetical protein n=1 Tax=Micromonospora aurantiaca (nom. illeg.) TaxID=47850 RepID=UPI003F4A2219
MVAVVEAYLDALSMELMHGYVVHRFHALTAMIEDFEVNSSSTWSKRSDAYTRYHRIEFSKCSEWNRFQAAISARNSIAHGLGRVTPLQEKSRRKLEANLRLVDVSIVDGELRFGPTTLDRVRRASTALIKHVDENTP